MSSQRAAERDYMTLEVTNKKYGGVTLPVLGTKQPEPPKVTTYADIFDRLKGK